MRLFHGISGHDVEKLGLSSITRFSVAEGIAGDVKAVSHHKQVGVAAQVTAPIPMARGWQLALLLAEVAAGAGALGRLHWGWLAVEQRVNGLDRLDVVEDFLLKAGRVQLCRRRPSCITKRLVPIKRPIITIAAISTSTKLKPCSVVVLTGLNARWAILTTSKEVVGAASHAAPSGAPKLKAWLSQSWRNPAMTLLPSGWLC